ncbi:MAG: hypothetical protein B6241_09705 [Spirochaetaceae bacterium 4572_59]|nr:MAG: hypothetical protein B6241_09705 [Spirochaetaceae bacterium 4572_59]
MKFLLKIILLILVPSFLLAGNTDIKFNLKFISDFSIGISQDKEGFIWIGTANGLHKYDGISLVNYQQSADGLSSNIAPVVFTDSEGLIWIGTAGGGLNVYDKDHDSFTVYHHDDNDPHSISSDSFLWAVDQIAEDSEGLIWAGTAYGLNCFNKQTGEFTRYLHDPENPESLSHNEVWAVFSDKEGLLWVATRNGLNSFNKETGKFTGYYHDPADPTTLSDNWVYSVIEDSRGDIWVGTQNGGLNSLNKESGHFTHFRSDPDDPDSLHLDEVFFLREDRQGDIWIGRSYSNPIGLERFIPEEKKFILYSHDPENTDSLPGNFVQSFLEDRNGILWVVDDLGPVSTYDRQLPDFHQFSENPSGARGIPSNMLTTIIEDSQGEIWIGTIDSGLIRYNRDSGLFTSYKHDPRDPLSIPHNYVYSVMEDSDEELWIGTNDGRLSRFDRTENRVADSFLNEYTQEAAQGLIQDSADPALFWFGTGRGGMYRFNKNSGEFTQYSHFFGESTSLSHNSIGDIFQDEKGTLWISSLGGGLIRFSKEKESFESFVYDEKDPLSIGSNDIRDIFIDSMGSFWVCTSGGGLNKFDREKGQFVRINKAKGFPTDVLFSINEDHLGNLWITSDVGLIKFDLKTESVVNTYTEDAGLQGNSFSFFPTSSLMTEDGEIWICGSNGVNTFYPDNIQSNHNMPSVYLTSLKQDGEEMDLSSAPERVKRLDLHWNQNSFEFEFAALNYTLSEKNRYAYMLEGVDKDWYYSDEKNFGRFSAIPDGYHTLRIKASNNDGLWNSEGNSIVVYVKPPFWRTLVFRLFLTALIFFVFWEFYKIRLRNIKKRNRILEKSVNERTEELRKINKELVSLSLTDPLTKLNNRRFLDGTIGLDISRINRKFYSWSKNSQRGHHPEDKLVIVLLDLDFFKKVNDLYGHSTGDSVLIEVGEILRSICRESDTIIRWGGEEFLIISRDTENSPELLAQRILDKFRNHSFKTSSDKTISISCSIGMAVYPFLPKFYEKIHWEQVISIADKALYAVKDSGRDGYLHLHASENLSSEDMLEQAVKKIHESVDNGRLGITSNHKNLKGAAFSKD